MRWQFYKYQGTGNDFVILDNRDQSNNQLTREQVAFLCNRRFGIGGDGLMMLNEKEGYDFEMIYYNADGNKSSMCGNGGRCLVQFANHIGIKKEKYHFLAVDGEHEAYIKDDGTVAVKMKDVKGIRNKDGNYFVDTGSPHYVCFEHDIDSINVIAKGREIRYSPAFEGNGINVNFIETTGRNDIIKVRTYERGVEDETLSCGTGVTACAIVAAHNQAGFNHVEVITKGGSLSVEFDKKDDLFTNVWLMGAAIKVFEGSIEID